VTGVGQPAKRIEDRRFVAGQGRYVDVSASVRNKQLRYASARVGEPRI